MNGKVLVTGAGGYIGSIAVYQLLQKGYSVVALDNFSTGFKAPLDLLMHRFGSSKLSIYEGNINDVIESVLSSEKEITSVIHYAANCSVDESMHNPHKYFQNNTLSTLKLLEALRSSAINKLIFSSTCAVYGEADHVPVSENTPTNPTNPYGESKLMSEELLGWYSKIYGLECVVLRYFNVCGASKDGLLGDSKKPSVHLVQNVIRGALGIEPFYLTAPEVETPDKTPIRDYVDVLDLNDAHIQALEYLYAGGKSEVINIGTGKGDSVLEILQAIEKKTNVSIPINRNNTRKGEYAAMIADISKAKKILDWQPQRTLEDSIDSLILWYTQNPNGWSK